MVRLGKGDVLVWCGSPDVLVVGRRVTLEAPGTELGTWVVTELDAKGKPTPQTVTVDIRDLITEDMA
jgi:hypothetical protein